MAELRPICAVLFTLAFSTAHAGGADYSANTYLPGCKAGVDGKGTPEAARCLGTIEGLAILGQVNHLWCAPDTTTTGQWIRVINSYIEARPGRMHEDFGLLSVEALMLTWPCQK